MFLNKKLRGVIVSEVPSTMLTAYQNSDYLAVRIRAEASEPREPRSIRIAFLVDVSDSMNGERLTCVKRTLHAARGLFAEGDRITMVTFGSAAAVLANNVGYDGLDAFYGAVDALTTAGGTNLSAGIEKLASISVPGSYDALVLLTDGQINQGVLSTAALGAMIQSMCASPITALGYGPDHNQILMRDLGLRSRGSYIYVDSESMMPAAMGDLISGVRTEVLQWVRLHVPIGLECCEYGSGSSGSGSGSGSSGSGSSNIIGSSYYVGNIVPDRDYWAVFRKRNAVEVTPIDLTSASGFRETLTWCGVSDCYDLKEQVLRCRVATAMLTSDKNQIESLIEEIRASTAEFQARPLTVNMLGRLVEAAQICNAPPAPAALARMISGGAYLSVQRGVTSVGETNTFSSPRQRMTSQQTQVAYEAE
jgi:hypothetical protein